MQWHILAVVAVAFGLAGTGWLILRKRPEKHRPGVPSAPPVKDQLDRPPRRPLEP